MKLGIKETKELCIFVACLISEGGEIMEDNKVGLGDIGNVIAIIKKAPTAFTGITDIPKELGDLDDAEAQDLIKTLKEETELDNQIIEDRIENIFAMAMNFGVVLIDVVNQFKKAKSDA